MRFPVIGAPLFIMSNPDLVIEQCKAGIVGSLPALNARPKELLVEWLTSIRSALTEHDAAHPDTPAAPYAANLVAHRSNERLAGAIANGLEILAAQVMGADLVYMGSPFIATPEANAAPAYKQMLVDCGAQDIIHTNHFTGVHGNFLRPSLVASGLDSDQLPAREAGSVSLAATAMPIRHRGGRRYGAPGMESVRSTAFRPRANSSSGLARSMQTRTGPARRSVRNGASIPSARLIPFIHWRNHDTR